MKSEHKNYLIYKRTTFDYSDIYEFKEFYFKNTLINESSEQKNFVPIMKMFDVTHMYDKRDHIRYGSGNLNFKNRRSTKQNTFSIP